MHASKMLVALFIALLLASTATAMTELDYGSHDINVTLQPGEDVAYIINMGKGDHLVVSLEVAQGGNVDIYLTNLTAYNFYDAGYLDSLYYLSDQSREDCSVMRYSYDSLVENEYVLLIDNSADTEGGAAPVGPVTIEGDITIERNIWTIQNIAITLAVTVCIVLFMIYLRWPKKRA